MPLKDAVNGIVRAAIKELAAAIEDQVCANLKKRQISKNSPMTDSAMPADIAQRRLEAAKERVAAARELRRSRKPFLLRFRGKKTARTGLAIAEGLLAEAEIEEREARASTAARRQIEVYEKRLSTAERDIESVEKTLVLLVMMALEANDIKADHIQPDDPESQTDIHERSFSERARPMIAALAAMSGKYLPGPGIYWKPGDLKAMPLFLELPTRGKERGGAAA